MILGEKKGNMTTSMPVGPGSLKNQILSHYLFNSDHGLAKDQSLNPAVERLFNDIVAITYPGQQELAEREWGVSPEASPFEKLQAAFRFIMDKDTPVVTTSHRGNLVDFYRALRTQKNEKLKGSRLILWKALSEGTFDVDKYRDCSGNQVKEGFNQWINEHSEVLDRTSLDLSFKNLDYLPPEIGRFTSLESLFLSGNKNLKELPREIGLLSSLMGLSLDSCSLRELPDEIENLTQLQLLNLQSNDLKELPVGIGKLSQLRKLNLEFNSLASLPPGMGKLTQLDSLTLSRNERLKALPPEIWNLGNLTWLILPDGIKTLPREVGCLSKLESLTVGSELLSKLPKSVRQKAVFSMFLRHQLDRLIEMGLLDKASHT